MSSIVVCGLPICLPFALAFRKPLTTRALIIRNSSSANTPDIWMNAFVIGSSSPLEQSTWILPTMESRKHFFFTVSIISHNCFVLLAKRETSRVNIVSPCFAVSRREESCSFITLSPCSYSKKYLFCSCGFQFPHLTLYLHVPQLPFQDTAKQLLRSIYCVTSF